MILGIGVDLCDVQRIQRSLTGLGERWINHLFTPAERAEIETGPHPVLAFAQGFCAKEAFSKAIGRGVADGVGWRDIEALGIRTEPSIRLSGGAWDAVAELLPEGHKSVVHVAYGGTRIYPSAIVVLSAQPALQMP